MHHSVQVRVEGKRGCGYRKIGGLYLVFNGPTGSCGKLPVSLDMLNRCPHCHEPLPVDYGVRPSRAPRMLQNPELLWRDVACNSNGHCQSCPLSNAYETGPALLLWIGEMHYPTPQEFNQEAVSMGISRRIAQLPEGFEVGETWVLLAHAKAIQKREPVTEDEDGQLLLVPGEKIVYSPGVFGLFRPSAIEIVVSGDEPDEMIEGYIKRGLTPVKVENPDQPELAGDQAALLDEE